MLTDKNDHRKTVVIFGISGFIGSNLAEFFKKDYKVVGTYYRSPVTIPGILTLPCDVLSKEEVQLIIFAFKPDVTIYCVGVSSVYKCAQNNDLAEVLNTSGLFNVAESCQRYKSLVCYLSSGFVFGGEPKKYLEMDISDADTIYGKTQAATEFYLQKTSLNYIIFRTCKIYGRSLNLKNPTWFESLQKKLKNNETVVCDGFVELGFLDVYYLAMIMKICFDKGVKNRLFQISSKNTMSHYEFAKTYCSIFGDNSKLLSKGNWVLPLMKNRTGLPKQNANTSFYLDVGNIEGFFDIDIPLIEESLRFTYKRFFGQKKKRRGEKLGSGINFI